MHSTYANAPIAHQQSTRRPSKDDNADQIMADDRRQVPLTVEEMKSMSERELFQYLSSRNRERTMASKHLTEDEKRMAVSSLCELNRRWKHLAGARVTRFDDRDIGVLTHEEVDSLSKSEVKEIIRARRHLQYIQEARDKGKLLYTCCTCGGLAVQGDNHQCIVAQWGPTTYKRGIPHGERVTVSMPSKNTIRVTKKPSVDLPAVQQQIEALGHYEQLQRMKITPTSIPQATEPTAAAPLSLSPATMSATPMATPAHVSAAAPAPPRILPQPTPRNTGATPTHGTMWEPSAVVDTEPNHEQNSPPPSLAHSIASSDYAASPYYSPAPTQVNDPTRACALNSVLDVVSVLTESAGLFDVQNYSRSPCRTR